MRLKSITKRCFFLTAFVSIISGCVAPPTEVIEVPPPPPCTIPSGYSIDKGMHQGLKTMRTPGCGKLFDKIFQALLNISSHRPSIKNRKKFVIFFEKLVQENKIPFKKTNILFRTYFDDNLVALGSSRKISFFRNKPKVIEQIIEREMAKKKIGFEDVMGLKKEFRKLQIKVNNFKNTFRILADIK